MPSALLQRISTATDKQYPHDHRCSSLTTATTPISDSSTLQVPQALIQQLRDCSLSPSDYDVVLASHSHRLMDPSLQVCSSLVKRVAAPLSSVWSVVRRFENPHAYKHFLKSCHVISGDGNSVGALREVTVVSGLPAESSIERLEILDEESHVISFSVVGGEHRLKNYRSVTTLHHEHAPPATGTGTGTGTGTVVVESYVVDVPPGNTREDTCVFVDTIVRCNLQWLAELLVDDDNNNNNNTSRIKRSSNDVVH